MRGRYSQNLLVTVRHKKPLAVQITTQIQSGGGEAYSGSYEVTPSVHGDIVLDTKQKILNQDIRILRVPQYEVENLAEGLTLFIGENE